MRLNATECDVQFMEHHVRDWKELILAMVQDAAGRSQLESAGIKM